MPGQKTDVGNLHIFGLKYMQGPCGVPCTPNTKINMQTLTKFCDCFTGKTEFNPETTKLLEDWIDAYHSQLPALRNFILPVSVEDFPKID